MPPITSAKNGFPQSPGSPDFHTPQSSPLISSKNGSPLSPGSPGFHSSRSSPMCSHVPSSGPSVHISKEMSCPTIRSVAGNVSGNGLALAESPVDGRAYWEWHVGKFDSDKEHCMVGVASKRNPQFHSMLGGSGSGAFGRVGNIAQQESADFLLFRFFLFSCVPV